MLEYRITARRSAPARATASCKKAELALDITPTEKNEEIPAALVASSDVDPLC